MYYSVVPLKVYIWYMYIDNSFSPSLHVYNYTYMYYVIYVHVAATLCMCYCMYALYIYVCRCGYAPYQVFKRMGIPGPTPLPFLGNFISLNVSHFL